MAEAVERFPASLPTATTRTSYARTLNRLTGLAGPRPVPELAPDDYAAVMAHMHGAAAATWNRHLSALVSFTTWAQRQDVLATNPARRLQRRKTARREDRAIPQARLEALFTDLGHALRERLLWRMLHETAARAEKILSLDIEDLDPHLRRARVTSKGGAIDYVHWATATARLLPRLVNGRTIRRGRELPDQLVAGDLRERAQLLLIATGPLDAAGFRRGGGWPLRRCRRGRTGRPVRPGAPIPRWLPAGR